METKLLTILAVILVMSSCGRDRREQDIADEMPPIGFHADSLSARAGKVDSGETFTSLMTRLGMSSDAAYDMAQKCEGVFDVRKLRAGNTFNAYYNPASGDLDYVVYDNDKIHQTVFKCSEPHGVWRFDKEVTYELKYADVTIRTSLWNDMAAQGASPDLILKLYDIYAWTVDFFGLQEEDRFRMLFGQTLCEDEFISVDTVYYAVFSRDGKDKLAVMYDQGDGGNRYWNENGESLRKAFLKAPLHFTRISSGFSYHRRHPVSGRVRPHTAVDYAAPHGTPVMSIGDGTVQSAGWSGGGGNTVKIRHNDMYTTSYMHLSKYAKGIKAGAHVKQGQVIGYVGATGTATGPHLDFRVYKNGAPINPLKMESPTTDPIQPSNKPALDAALARYRHLADSLTQVSERQQ